MITTGISTIVFWCVAILAIVWGVVATYFAQKARKKTERIQKQYDDYRILASGAIDQAEVRLNSLETQFKTTLDEVRRQCDFKLGAIGRQTTNIIADMQVGKTHKIQAITEVKAAIDNEIELGYQL